MGIPIFCSVDYLNIFVSLLVLCPSKKKFFKPYMSLTIYSIGVLIHRLTDKFFSHCPLHPNPLVQQIGNYTLADLTNFYKTYKHKRTKHILL
jgi:hypothetical protein